MSDREKLAVRLEQETRVRLERCYTMDGSSSRREFIEKAIRFYMDYLEMNNGSTLAKTIMVVIPRISMYTEIKELIQGKGAGL